MPFELTNYHFNGVLAIVFFDARSVLQTLSVCQFAFQKCICASDANLLNTPLGSSSVLTINTV